MYGISISASFSTSVSICVCVHVVCKKQEALTSCCIYDEISLTPGKEADFKVEKYLDYASHSKSGVHGKVVDIYLWYITRIYEP